MIRWRLYRATSSTVSSAAGSTRGASGTTLSFVLVPDPNSASRRGVPARPGLRERPGVRAAGAHAGGLYTQRLLHHDRRQGAVARAWQVRVAQRVADLVVD